MIWIVIDHPQQFMTALGLRQLFKEKKIGIIVSLHEYFKKTNKDDFKYFHCVYRFKRPWMGKNILKNIYYLRNAKDKLNTLIKQHDILIGLSACQLIENIALSMRKDFWRILIAPEVVYYDAYFSNLDDYKESIQSKLYNKIFSAFSINNVFYGYKKDDSASHDEMPYLLRYIKPLHELYDYLFFMTFSSPGDKIDIYKNSYWLPYIVYKRECSQAKKQVVFFGNCFLKYNYLPHNIYIKRTNDFLDFIRYFYRNCKLIYKPHPNETDEIKYLNLDGFEIGYSSVTAEQLFQSNYCNIEACFSISSTAIRNALTYGINAYSFLNLMGFDKKLRYYFKQLYGRLPEDVYINTLEEKPNKLNLKTSKQELKTLVRLIDELYEN